MAFCEAYSFSRLAGGIDGEGGGTGGRNVPLRRVEDSETSSYMPLPKRIRTIYHKVVHTIRKSVDLHEQYVGIHKCRKLMKSEHDCSQGLTKIISPRSVVAVRKNDPRTVLCKNDHELYAKVEKNYPRFPMVIYTPTNSRQFRHYDFWTMTRSCWKLCFGQIATSKEIWPLRLFRWDSSPKQNSKRLGNSPSFLPVT
jgi:hypothetical protein